MKLYQTVLFILFSFVIAACVPFGNHSILNLGSNQLIVQPPAPSPSSHMSWDIQSIDYGSVQLGSQSPDYTFTLTNNGSVDSTSCSAPVLSDMNHFVIISDTCGVNDLPAGDSCQVVVAGLPTASALHQANLSRTCANGGTAETAPNQIEVFGTLPTDWKQAYDISPFSTVRSSGGESNEYSYYFRNPNSESLTQCTTPTLTNATDFSIVSDNCGTNNLPAYSLCEVKIKANPITVGAKTSALNRTCYQSGAVTINLSANGVSSTTTVDISSGVSHSLALQSDGTIKAWGNNNYGQLGAGHSSIVQTPVVVSGISNAISVSAGRDHSCAVLADQSIQCWGSNYYGQLGSGSPSGIYMTPVTVSGINNAVEVHAGALHTCARLQNQSLKCWGYNYNGQLGNGNSTDSNLPVDVVNITNAISLSVGQTHTCAVLSDNTVQCWGYNYFGQLGNSQEFSGFNPVSTPVTVVGISNASKVSIADYFSCALLLDNTVKCWGYGSLGELGNGSNTYQTYNPVVVSGISTAIDLKSSGKHACAKLNDGTLRCWGENDKGQLGNRNATNKSTPVNVTGVSGVISLSLGEKFSCALLSNQKVSCWGDNTSGQLGDATTLTKTTNILVPGISNAIDVGQGYNRTCVLLADQTVKCWGYNVFGQTGDGTDNDTVVPTTVIGLNTATTLSTGSSHSCSVLSNNTITCWGNNGSGQLGHNNGGQTLTPVTVFGINTAVQVSAGGSHTCAVLADHTIQCWGYNAYGQLGDGTQNNTIAPVAVNGITNAVQVFTSNNTTCALLQDQTVSCWGDNSNGQIGDGTYNNQLAPTAASGLNSVTEIRASSSGHTCALLVDKTVRCWGGSYGPSPAAVIGLQDVIKLGGGENHHCALLTNQRVQCWGQNQLGQLGTGTTDNGPFNTTLHYRLNHENISSIGSSSFGTHQCSVKSGEVICTGDNNYGATGFNEYLPRTVSGL